MRVQLNRDQPSLENGKALVTLFCHWGMPGLARNYVWRDENFGRRWRYVHDYEDIKRRQADEYGLTDIGGDSSSDYAGYVGR
jgi:hypothetical protein